MAHEFFMKIKGETQQQFKGESKQEDKKKEYMPCIWWEMGGLVPFDPNSGEVKGQRQHQPLKVVKEAGAASPQILQAMWTNETLPEVVLEFFYTPGTGAQVPLETVKLKNARIINVRRYIEKSAKGAQEHDLETLEEIKFMYEEISVANHPGSTESADSWVKPNRK